MNQNFYFPFARGRELGGVHASVNWPRPEAMEKWKGGRRNGYETHPGLIGIALAQGLLWC